MGEPIQYGLSKPRITAATIVGIYTGLGLLWTGFFGGLFDVPAAGANKLEELLPYPGVVFMFASAVLLYVLIRENNACLLQSQQRLRESHELLNAILENSTSLVIYLKDLRGRYLMVNHQFEILCNSAGSEIIGKSDRELFPNHIAEASIRSDEQAIAIPAPQQFEEVIGGADNERTYLTVKFSLCDRTGKPYAVCGIATDISERKSMEEALRKSEDRFRDVTEAASDWIWETDENQRFTHLSHRFYQLTAIPPEQVLGHARWEIADTESDEDKWTRHRETLERHEPFRDFVYQTRVADSNSQRHHFKISGKPIFDSQGQFRGFRGTGSDITEQVAAEAALRESQRALSTLMSNLPGMAYRCRNDENWTMEFVSTGSSKLTGYSPDDLIGNRQVTYGDLIHPADRPTVFSAVQAAVLERRAYQHSYRIRTASGEEKWVWEQGCGIFSTEDEFQALEGLVLDMTEHKRAEQLLLASEERNRLTVDTALDAVITIDADGIITGWNAQAQTTFGFSRPEILRRRLSDAIVPARYRHAHDHGLQHYLKTGEGPMLNRRFEIVALHRDGHEFPVEIAIVPLRTGEHVTFSAFVRDITDRRQAEERLRESEEKLRLTLEHAPIGISTVDIEGHIVNVNPAFTTVLGYSTEELLQMSIADITHPDDRDETRRNHAALLEGRKSSFEQEKRYVRKDGSTVLVRVHAGIVRDTNSRPLLIVGEVEDITEKKRADQEMARMRLYLKNIIDYMPSVLVGVDSQGTIVEWNQQAETLTGLSRSHAKGRFFGDAMPQLKAQLEQVQQTIRERRPMKTQRLAAEVDGEIHYSDVMVYPLTADGAMGAVIRLDDVTARVRIEEMMVQTEKMLSVGGLAAGMAHEINNPLGAILQGSQNILRRLSPDLSKNREVAKALGIDLGHVNRYLDERGIHHFLKGIHEAGTRAGKIVTDMLAFSRRSESRFSHADIAALLDTVIRLAGSDYDLKKTYDFKRINIVRDYDPNLGAVYCDTTQIEQVLLNLVKNAAQATADSSTPAPTITLRTRREPHYTRIDVIDNGPGMDERTRMRVFEPFFTTKEVGVGTGLGLSVSYFIVTEQHKGTLSVISAPGQGARFVIRLPAPTEE